MPAGRNATKVNSTACSEIFFIPLVFCSNTHISPDYIPRCYPGFRLHQRCAEIPYHVPENKHHIRDNCCYPDPLNLAEQAHNKASLLVIQSLYRSEKVRINFHQHFFAIYVCNNLVVLFLIQRSVDRHYRFKLFVRHIHNSIFICFCLCESFLLFFRYFYGFDRFYFGIGRFQKLSPNLFDSKCGHFAFRRYYLHHLSYAFEFRHFIEGPENPVGFGGTPYDESINYHALKRVNNRRSGACCPPKHFSCLS